MKKILFVCAENAGRSQMAEAFFNFYAEKYDFKGESAGTFPAKEINSLAAEVMREKGIDITGKIPKLLDAER